MDIKIISGLKELNESELQGHKNKPQSFLDSIKIKKGSYIVDLGCGTGEYSLLAAIAAGVDGCVFAVDKWPELLMGISGKAREIGLSNIKPVCLDFTKDIHPFITSSIDMVFLIDVFDIPTINEKRDFFLREISRVLKPEGKIILVLEGTGKKDLEYCDNRIKTMEKMITEYEFFKSSEIRYPNGKYIGSFLSI